MWMKYQVWALLLVSLHLNQAVHAGELLDKFQSQLRSSHIDPSLQGVYLADSQGRIIEHYQDHTPLPAASVTKLATTLAALDYWGVNHQFATRVYTDGSIDNGVLKGNLYIQGDADPLFLWEDGMILGQRLEQAGIRQVTGDLVVSGSFWMNFSTNTQASILTLKTALNSSLWPARLSALRQQKNLPAPHIQILGSVRKVDVPPWTSALPLLSYPSQPLWKIAKRMNAYSSNPMADMLAASAGGPAAIQQQLKQTYAFLGSEFSLEQASGLGRDNRLSPGAVASLITTLDQHMSEAGLKLADVMAVKGPDPGTLKKRGMPLGVVAKTGTLNNVSCLAGVIDTQSLGPLRFVLLNQGPVATLRKLQDSFLQAILTRYGKPASIPFVSSGLLDFRLPQARPSVLAEDPAQTTGY